MLNNFTENSFNKIQHAVKKPRQFPIVENIVLVWLDANINESHPDFSHSLRNLREIVHVINTYTNVDECMNFIKQIEDESIFLIVSGSLGKQIISDIHDMHQIDSIYVFCRKIERHQPWTSQWAKIRGIYKNILHIIEAISDDARKVNRTLVSVRIADTKYVNYLDPTFMYTALFKEIILEIDYNQQSMESLVNECKQRYEGNDDELQIIEEFKNEYRNHTPLWWYTRDCFLFQILNRALRTFEIDIILFMGTFIRDLDYRIEQLHGEQKHNLNTEFTVYRGQGLLKTDFDILRNSSQGLFAFNSFLSTSENRDISYHFACGALVKTDHVGVLFRMIIQSSMGKPTFAVLHEESYFEGSEEEIVFSMNCVFRIGRVTPLDKENLFEVELTLTTPENDEQLEKLTERIRSEINGPTGRHRMAHLLLLLDSPKEALEFYQHLLEKTSEDNYEELSHLNQKIGMCYVKLQQCDKAILSLKKAIDIREKHLADKHLDIAACYNDLGVAYECKQECVNALKYFGKSLEIRENSVHEENICLLQLYDDIGRMHHRLNEYTRAFEYFTKVLEIRQKNLPENHPDLAMSYSNLGTLCADMDKCTDARRYLQTSYEIYKKSLPPYHSQIRKINQNLGIFLLRLGENAKAFEYVENDVKIAEKILRSNDLELANVYRDIGTLCFSLGNAAKALDYCKKELIIREKFDSLDKLRLAETYHNLSILYESTGDDPTIVLTYAKKAIELKETFSPPIYCNLASSYQHITKVYQHLGYHGEMIEFAEKFIEMQEKGFSDNHCGLSSSYDFMIVTYLNINNYRKALDYQLKMHEILKETTISTNSPDLSKSYGNMAFFYEKLGQYTKALECKENALKIDEHLSYLTKDDLVDQYVDLCYTCRTMGLFSKALEWNKKLLECVKNTHSIDRLQLATAYTCAGQMYFAMKDYSTALIHFQNSKTITEQIFPRNDLILFAINHEICQLYFELEDLSKAHEAAQICFYMHQTLPSLSSNRDVMYYLGKIYFYLGNYSTAMSYFAAAIDISKRTQVEADENLGMAYSRLGNVQQLIGDYNNALLSLCQSMNVLESTFSERIELANTYSYMGETYRKMRYYSAAILFFGYALKIRERLTPEKHPELAISYYDLSKVYKDMNQNNKMAFEYAQKAFEIARYALPETHPLCEKCKLMVMHLEQFL